MKHQLRLVSFKLCPFVQRSIITLKHLGVDFDIDYINLMEQPEWFKALSPMGKVPILQVDGEHVIFESAVINELLSEINPPILHPHCPFERAKNRAWIEYAGQMIPNQYMMTFAKDEVVFAEKRDALKGQITRLEQQLGDGPYFNGEDFNLIDAAYAPLFTRFAIMDEVKPLGMLDDAPKMKAWSDVLLAMPEVQESTVPEFNELLFGRMKGQEAYLAQFV